MIFVDGVAGGRFWSFFNFIQKDGQLPGAKVQDAIGEVGSAVASGWDAKGRMTWPFLRQEWGGGKAISMDSDGLGEHFPTDSDGLKRAQHGRSRGNI